MQCGGVMRKTKRDVEMKTALLLEQFDNISTIHTPLINKEVQALLLLENKATGEFNWVLYCLTSLEQLSVAEFSGE